MLENSRNNEIDRLRGFAIFLVVLSHLQITILDRSLPRFLGEGWSGVDLFFVISGFVVTRSFCSWLSNDSPLPWKQRCRLAGHYILRRFVRILPIAWLWAAIPVLLAHTINKSGALGDPSLVLEEMFAVWRFNYNYFTAATGYAIICHYWSLAVEEHFYIFLPFFLLLVRTRTNRLLGFISIILGITWLRFYHWDGPNSNFSNFLFRTEYRADGIAMGSALALLANSYPKIAAEIQARAKLYFGLKILAVLMLAIIWFLPGTLTQAEIVLYGFSTLALASSILVLLAGLEIKFIFECGKFGRALAIMGRRSYSLYLVHFPVVLLFYEFRFRLYDLRSGWPSALHASIGVSLYILALLLITEITYRYLEQPLVRLARGIRNPIVN